MRRSGLRPRAIPRSSTLVLIAAAYAGGRCPPEDIGGPWGYAEFRDAIHDPKHERHAELKEWTAADFDPKVGGAEGFAEEVAALAETLVSEISGQAYTPYLIRGPDRRGYTSPDTSRYPTYDKGSVWFATPSR
jgi:Plasmid pRiA4b ORF-3-like protein